MKRLLSVGVICATALSAPVRHMLKFAVILALTGGGCATVKLDVVESSPAPLDAACIRSSPGKAVRGPGGQIQDGPCQRSSARIVLDALSLEDIQAIGFLR